MILTSFQRILRAGAIGVWRNSFISLASIFVMTMTVSIIGSLMFLSALIGQFVSYVENKVDVNVYFVTTAPESAVLDLKAQLEALPEVAFVAYATREENEQTFRARHEDDRDIVGALDELGENPFGASLSIKANDSVQFESIYQFVKDTQDAEVGVPTIDYINYERNKAVIDQLTVVTDYVERFGLIVIIVFVLASIVITFNTIRLAIYSSRDEIGVVSLIIFFPLSYALRGASESLFNADIFSYYLTHLPLFILVLILSGALLGAVSSYLAVRKYLSV